MHHQDETKPPPDPSQFPNDSIAPSSSCNELLIKKSLLKPVPTSESVKQQATKTPFDFWLLHNNILLEDFCDDHKPTSDKCSVDEWASTLSKQTAHRRTVDTKHFKRSSEITADNLKYYDEHFKEIDPEIASGKNCTQPKVLLPRPKAKAERMIPKLDCSVSTVLEKCKVSEDKCNIRIRLIQQNSYNKQTTQTLSFNVGQNSLCVFPRVKSRIENHEVPKCLRELKNQAGWSSLWHRNICQTSSNLPYLNVHQFKFLFKANMSDHNRFVPPEQIYERVVDWLSSNDFQKQEASCAKSRVENDVETNIPDNQSDITSITKVISRNEHAKSLEKTKALEEETEEDPIPKATSEKTLTQDSSDTRLQAVVERLKNNVMVNSLRKITDLSSWQLYNKRIKSNSKPPSIPAILEKDEIVCFPLYTLTSLLLVYLLRKYDQYLVNLLFCPY